MSAAIVYIYATLLALGGLIGYLKAGSFASLFMGLLSGLLAMYSANLQTTNRKSGLQLTMLLSLFMLLFMGYRFYNSQKFMPAGLVTVFSLFVLLKSFSDYQYIA